MNRVPRFDVLSVGELNPDLILAGIRAEKPVLGTEQEIGSYRLTLGSSTAIATVLMRRLGMSAAFCGRVGDDNYGRFCQARLTEEHVDASAVIIDPATETGLTVSLPYPADRLLLTCYGAMARLTVEDVPRDLLAGARHLHSGSFFIQRSLRPHLAELFCEARRLGATTSLDTGWDPDEHWLTPDLEAVLAQTDVFVPNEIEFEKITGTSDPDRGFARLFAMGVGEVLLKRGAAGSIYAGPEGRFEHTGFPIVPLDTTGSGDACNAGYLKARLDGLQPRDRLELGNACGALTALAIGGTGGLWSLDQAKTFIAENSTSRP